ncbi:MAG: CDP-alcohol phosphatidyltransferase family protein [Flavobacteriales bacterium]|nr:CDP-alcohol phosphatidyltransferase family protein [Flavobacteriales bacterium]
MISVYKLKPKFQQLLNPILMLFRRIGISPNHITVFSVLFSVLVGYILLLAQENSLFYLFVALGLLFRMMLNALDGMMAKKYNLQSKTGEILNEVGDILSDIAIYFPFIYFEGITLEYVIGFLLLSVINEFCGLLAKIISGERRYDGPMGKSDRALLVGLICIALFFSDSILRYIDYLFIIAMIMMFISSLLRITKSIIR